jgi:hypothetical protein
LGCGKRRNVYAGNLRLNVHLENLGVDGKKILKFIF